MTQKRDDAAMLAELTALFIALDDKGQDSALTVLRSLRFAQSVSGLSNQSQPSPPTADTSKP